MKRGLKVGMSSTVRFSVDESMLASFEGKRIHDVLSTFHLVYYAELAARNLIEPFLDDSEDAAGHEISLRHLAPTKIGEIVELTATLSGKDGKRLISKIEGKNQTGRICYGTQTQVLIRKGKLG